MKIFNILFSVMLMFILIQCPAYAAEGSYIRNWDTSANNVYLLDLVVNDSNIYTMDSSVGGAIEKRDINGTYISEIALTDITAWSMHGITKNDSDYIILDGGSRSWNVYTFPAAVFEYAKGTGSTDNFMGIAQNNSHIFISDSTEKTINIYDKSIGFIGNLNISNCGDMDNRGIDIKNNIIWVVNRFNNSVSSFYLDGSCRGNFPLDASNLGAIGIDASTNIIYIADITDYKVYEYAGFTAGADTTPPVITSNLINNTSYNLSVNFYVSLNENGECLVNDTNWLKSASNLSYFTFNDNNAAAKNYNILISCNDTSLNPAYKVYNFTKSLRVNFTFVSQFPPDINTTNMFNNNLNVTYNITNLNNVSAVYIQIKKNDSFFTLPTYIKSVLQPALNNITYTSVSNITYFFSLNENYVLPANYNYDNQFIINATKQNIFVSGSNVAKNIFPLWQSLKYTFLELYAEPVGNQDLDIYFCNATYGAENVLTSSNCYQFYTLSHLESFNHCHSNISCHYVIPVPIINGYIGTVKVTSGNTFIYHSNGAGWNLKYTSSYPSTSGYLANSSNLGVSFSTITGTLDSHMHYFGNSSYFCYQALGDAASSGFRCDLFERGKIPPSSPVISHLNNSVSGNVSITWQQSTSINAYNITRYEFKLLNSTSTMLTVNTSNTLYVLNTALFPDNSYYITVYAFDSIKQNSSDTSPIFLIDNTAPAITINSINMTYNETYSQNIYINFTTNENASCSLNSSYWALSYTDNTFNSYYENGTAPSGFYAVNILCSDYAKNIGQKLIFFRKDIDYPFIAITSPSNNAYVLKSSQDFLLSFNVTENNDLYYAKYNITRLPVNIVYSDGFAYTSGKSYSYSDFLNTSIFPIGQYKLTVSACDSHTNNELLYAASHIAAEPSNIDFIFKDVKINIKSLDDSVLSTDVTELTDKYSFDFKYGETLKELHYEVSSDKKLEYIPYERSGYKGHFVIDDTFYLDFESDSVDYVYVELNDNNNYAVTAYLKDDAQQCPGLKCNELNSGIEKFTFNSVGFLNCNYAETIFNVANSAPIGSIYSTSSISGANWFDTSALDTKTQTGVLMYFFVTLLIIGVFVLGEVTRIPIFMLLSGILGFIFSILIFVSVSAVIGIVLGFISVCYLFRPMTM